MDWKIDLIVIVLAAALILLLSSWIRLFIENQQLRLDRRADQLRYGYAMHDNDVLRAYMDNDHVVWNDSTKDVLMRRPFDKKTVVLINSDALYSLIVECQTTGYVSASKGEIDKEYKGAVFKREKGTWVRIGKEINDKQFDHDYALFVNNLTKIAKAYGHTQQLRDRLSHQVLGFRVYLNNKLSGLEANFPKEI